MIKTITVINPQSESVVFDLRSPELSGFFIRGVDGLGPTKATINTSESPSMDGSRINSSRQNMRNIVFNLGFLEKPTIQDTRRASYKYFQIKEPIDIIVETDNRVCRTSGVVESNEPNIFSKDEGTIISVICPDAHFYSIAKTVINFSNTQALFEFPFSNESLTEKLIIFGNTANEPQNNIFYAGDSPVGIEMYIHVTGNVGTFTIFNLRTRQSMMIDSVILEELTGSPLISGDDVIISTVKGNKYVTLIRDGEEINILNTLGPNSSWFTLQRGDNIFYYTADSGEDHLQFRIEYWEVHEGV